MSETLHLEIPHIERARWGRDHWTTLLYLETVCVDGRGYPDDTKMRGRDPNYPARLANGEVAQMHSDYDCIDDMIVEGLVKQVPFGDGPPRALYRYALTDAGWAEAGRLRRERAEAGLRHG